MPESTNTYLAEIREKLGDAFREPLAATAKAILADEASLWLKSPDKNVLVMILNGNPSASDMELQAEQPLDTGLISQVFRSGKPFIDPHSLPTRNHSKKIDIEYSQVTHYMAIVPVIADGACVGVVSAVKFPNDGDRIRKASEWNFSKDALERLEALAAKIAASLQA